MGDFKSCSVDFNICFLKGGVLIIIWEVLISKAKKFNFIISPSKSSQLLLELVLINQYLIIDNGKQSTFIKSTSHVLQLLFNLEMALLEESRLEVGEDG